MKKLMLPCVLALLLMACKKDKEESIFTPSSFVFQDTLVDLEIEYYKGENCRLSQDSAVALHQKFFSNKIFQDAMFSSVAFYAQDKAYLYSESNGVTNKIQASVQFIGNTIIFEIEEYPGKITRLKAFRTLGSFYFLSGVSSVFDFTNGFSRSTQANGAMSEKHFRREEISDNGFQLNIYYHAPFVQQ